jgi:hypothetical protein
MLLYYNTHCHSQDLGFKGPNLAEKQHEEICLQAVQMNANGIHNLSSDCFYMESATDSMQRCLVNLGNMSCDCPDWPRVQLCKHVSAVELFFGDNNQQMGVGEVVLPEMPLPNQEASADTLSSTGATSTSILQNMISVSRGTLNNGVPSSMETV